MKTIKKILWYFTGRCTKCGGTIIDYSMWKSYCESCGAIFG